VLDHKLKHGICDVAPGESVRLGTRLYVKGRVMIDQMGEGALMISTAFALKVWCEATGEAPGVVMSAKRLVGLLRRATEAGKLRGLLHRHWRHVNGFVVVRDALTFTPTSKPDPAGFLADAAREAKRAGLTKADAIEAVLREYMQ
jgi:hypothetical protein